MIAVMKYDPEWFFFAVLEDLRAFNDENDLPIAKLPYRMQSQCRETSVQLKRLAYRSLKAADHALTNATEVPLDL